MQTSHDLESLIEEKRREIEKEKIALGLSQAANVQDEEDQNKENVRFKRKKVRVEERVGRDASTKEETAPVDEIPAELERYIRRYLGLPVMLKAGEFSPNNPLVRAERHTGDVLLGLGEYERRRNTLRKIQQQQYKEYLDQQAKKKQEAKAQAERERRECEEKERKREEERELARQQLEQDSITEQRRASVCYVPTVTSASCKSMVDTGVQVEIGSPLSVAVQTDTSELFHLSKSPSTYQLTQAERELSPRMVDGPTRPWPEDQGTRRRSYGDFYERPLIKRTGRDKLVSDLRHTYMPSIFDAEAIHMRNVQAEKEAAERRQYYQQELKDQILEQQRIREERKTREKMLEQAEMRRLEEQLGSLRGAHHMEVDRQRDISYKMKENTSEYEKKRLTLQNEIELEQQKLFRASVKHRRRTPTSQTVSKLPTFYKEDERQLPSFNKEKEIQLPTFYKDDERQLPSLSKNEDRAPFSTNIPDKSIFSPNYDVDTYLRKNLNPKKESLIATIDLHPDNTEKKVVLEKALIHEQPKEKKIEKPKYESRILRNLDEIQDERPIPVLRHSPILSSPKENVEVREGIKLIEDKWKVPVVQKNILKTLPNEEGKNVSILTQLGSIRRQLQLEQLRLDNMITKRH